MLVPLRDADGGALVSELLLRQEKEVKSHTSNEIHFLAKVSHVVTMNL